MTGILVVVVVAYLCDRREVTLSDWQDINIRELAYLSSYIVVVVVVVVVVSFCFTLKSD